MASQSLERSRMRTYYKECRYCGANLDPGEQCDCREAVRPSTITRNNKYDPLCTLKKQPLDSKRKVAG